MKIWIAEGSWPDSGETGITIGHWLTSGEMASAGSLVTVSSLETDTDDAASLLIPAGQALQPDLLRAAAKTGKPVLVGINGLGEGGIAQVRDALSTDQLCLLFETKGATPTDVMEQIAWLSQQPESFAIACDDRDQQIIAAATGAAALLVSNAGAIDIDALVRIAASRRDEARPLGPAETDGLAGQEMCLTVTKPISAGTEIAESDLAMAVTEYRGLAPIMSGAVIGQKLRYDLAPGEAIHFGHLEIDASQKSAEKESTGGTKISVIIRTKNEARWLRSCLHAVAHQDYPSFDIIVVDNESDDGSREIANEYGCKIIDISDEDFNFSRALNLGIAASDAPAIAILSGHCVPANEQWLARLAMNLRDPRVVAVYGRQEPLPDSSPVDKRDLWTTFGLDRKIQKRDYFFHNANSMIRRAAWEILPFNEQIQGVEDRDWAKKVLRDAAQIIYEPGASVFHHHGIHHDGSLERADRVVKVIELIQKDLT